MKKSPIFMFTLVLLMLTAALQTSAELVKTSETVLEDSEEPFLRRIYSYDFDVAPDGTIHVVYSRPVPGENRAQIVYTTRQPGGAWGAKIVLEESGLLESISTFLSIDTTGIVHVCYIVNRDFVDENGVHHAQGLVYQTIGNGVPGAKVNVSSGSFHTRMQINAQRRPIFAREYEVFLNSDGTLRTPPFPKALRILSPSGSQWTSAVANLPVAEDYRLANFVFDTQRNRYHVIYGDRNAVLLRNTYPTANPPLTSGVFFPPGSGHKLWHASSDNLVTWSTSIIDGSGNISENEFWTDLIIDANGTPWAASYRYATDTRGVQEGTSNIVGSLKADGTWAMQTVEGKTTGASPHRAGMGPKLLIDSAGRFHGIWDNSPDKPIDGEGPGGNVMYRFSPDGKNWAVRQALLPYSAEGQCRAKIHGDRFLLMVLGDARDARLVFADFVMPRPADNLIEISTDKMFYAPGETISLHARLQGNAVGDYRILAVGPFNVNQTTGAIQFLSTTRFSYLGSDAAWHTIPSLFDGQPLLRNIPLFDFNGDVLFSVARTTPPFTLPGRYALVSLLTRPGATLSDPSGFLTPVSIYMLHLCSQNNCAEL